MSFLFLVSYLEHLVDTCVLFVGMTCNLLTGGKKESITTFRFIKEYSKKDAPLQTKVDHSSKCSKRKGDLFLEWLLLEHLLGGQEVSSVPIIGGISSQSMDLDIPLMTSPTSHTFSKSTKLGGLDLHS